MNKKLTVLIAVLLSVAALFAIALAVYGGIGKIQSDNAFGKNTEAKERRIDEKVTDDDSKRGDTDANDTDADGVTDKMMDALVALTNLRLSNAGYDGATVTAIRNTHTVRVEVPEADDAEEITQLVGTLPRLYFFDSDGIIVLDGNGIVGVKAKTYRDEKTNMSSPAVVLKLDKDVRDSFAEATERIAAKAEDENYIAVIMDGQVVCAPFVSERIDGDEFIIATDSTEQAETLSRLIYSGILPCTLTVTECDESDGVSIVLRVTTNRDGA